MTAGRKEEDVIRPGQLRMFHSPVGPHQLDGCLFVVVSRIRAHIHGPGYGYDWTIWWDVKPRPFSVTHRWMLANTREI
jgi:hypothetical protein